MILLMEVQSQRQPPQWIKFNLWNLVIFQHLPQHHVPASQRLLRPPYRVEKRRILGHSHQHGGLFHLQRIGRCREINISGRINTDRQVQEVKLIKIHRDNLFLRVALLQLHRNHPFPEFTHGQLHEVLVCLPREQHFRQLLRDRTSPPGRRISGQHTLCHPEQPPHVNTAMIIETYVLRGNQRINNTLGYILIVHIPTVLTPLEILS